MTFRWLLPEQVEDLLPPDAWRLESARTRLLTLFRAHGYELVAPPALEYMESLLTGAGRSSDLVTFKVVDQLSGRLLGLRADITPQVARIDAHRLIGSGISRLCYAGSVYHALARGAGASREPFQIGAELYGHRGLAADLEVQGLLLDALAELGLHEFVLDLGHVGIFRALTADLAAGLAADLLGATQGKNIPLVEELTAGLPDDRRQALRALPLLCGGAEVIAEGHRVLPDLPGIREALVGLERAALALAGRCRIEIDLAELRGYDYHSGMVFAVYAARYPGSVARGGRYDAIGEAFGRSRPATGFSIDLRDLLPIIQAQPAQGIAWLALEQAACLPAGRRDALLRELRGHGLVVIPQLEGQPDQIDPRCDCRLELVGERFEIRVLEQDILRTSAR